MLRQDEDPGERVFDPDLVDPDLEKQMKTVTIVFVISSIAWGIEAPLPIASLSRQAEAIVVGRYEPRIDTAEASRNDEGPNIKMFQIKQESTNWWKSCYKRDRAKEV